MATLLIKNAQVVATMDDTGRELPDCDVLIEDRVIRQVGSKLAVTADEVIDARGCVVLPGFVNTHNHLFQTLYRVTAETQVGGFIDWITFFVNLWIKHPPHPDATHVAALVNFGEMLLTGTTLTADQHYPYFRGQPSNSVDRTIDAARAIGMRFHPARGCCTLGRARGGLIPDEIAWPEDVVLQHAQDLISKYHDPNPLAMVRLNLAPLSPYGDSELIYREMSKLADKHPGVGLHTHLHEISDVDFCRDHYGLRPLRYMERCGWLGDRVVFYHMSAPTPDADDIRFLAETGSHVSQCLGSDMRLGYEWAPLRELLDAGAPVCLGTTGCASNLGGHILLEARFTLAAHRMRHREPERWLSAREILRLATRGGAEALGRRDLGSIEPGKGADLAVFDVSGIDRVGHHDAVAALLYCGASHYTRATVVNGRVVARDGRLTLVDGDAIAREADAWARRAIPR